MINAPRVYDVPANDSPLAYNEDELVTVLTNIFQYFIEVAYLPERGILLPPKDTGRHTLDVNYLTNELHLNARVISLLERLPYVSPREDFPQCEWYPSAETVNYLDLKDALRSRDPHLSVAGGCDEANVDFMRPGDVALSFPANPSTYMTTLILDTTANSIRLLYNYCELPSCVDPAKLEVPEHERYYRNQPAYHAPTLLCDYYSILRSLDYVPFGMGSYYINGPHDVASSMSAHIMRRYYGWPDGFRRDAWREVADKVHDEAWEAGERLEKSLRLQMRDEPHTAQTLEETTAEVVAKLGLDIV